MERKEERELRQARARERYHKKKAEKAEQDRIEAEKKASGRVVIVKMSAEPTIVDFK